MMGFAHIEAMGSLIGYKYDRSKDIRRNKEMILSLYGFQNNIKTIKKTIGGSGYDSDLQDIKRYLSQMHQTGYYSALLLHNGVMESMGGCGVAYIMSDSDIDEAIISDTDGTPIGLRTDRGVYNLKGKPHVADIYSRKSSKYTTLIDTRDNSERTVRLGGGFRIQLDGFFTESETTVLSFFVEMIFDDYGTRMLANINDSDMRYYKKSIIVRVPLENGRLGVPEQMIPRIENIKTFDDAVSYIMGVFILKNHGSINDIFSHMMTIRPVLRVHQLEGICRVDDYGNVEAEIIDFDGLDMFDMEASAVSKYNPSELLVGNMLKTAGFISRYDAEALISYLKQRESISFALTELHQKNSIPESVYKLVHMRDDECTLNYYTRLDMYAFMGRLLRCVGNIMKVRKHGNIFTMYSDKQGYVIYFFDIEGFLVAVPEVDKKLIHVSSRAEAIALLQNEFGIKMLPVHIHYAYEGD